MENLIVQAMLVLTFVATAGADTAPRPNIALIMADDMGYAGQVHWFWG